MRTANLKMKLDEVGNFFSPKELGRLLGLNVKRAYEVTRLPGFPARRFGQKIVISKSGFVRWFDEL